MPIAFYRTADGARDGQILIVFLFDGEFVLILGNFIFEFSLSERHTSRSHAHSFTALVNAHLNLFSNFARTHTLTLFDTFRRVGTT